MSVKLNWEQLVGKIDLVSYVCLNNKILLKGRQQIKHKKCKQNFPSQRFNSKYPIKILCLHHSLKSIHVFLNYFLDTSNILRKQ